MARRGLVQQVPAVPRRVPDEAELVELAAAALVAGDVVEPPPDLARAAPQGQARGPRGPRGVARGHDEGARHEEVAEDVAERRERLDDEVVLGLEPLPDEAEVPELALAVREAHDVRAVEAHAVDRAVLGSKRVRNSQLWRLLSRSFSTRFGSFLDGRSSLGTVSTRGCFFRNARARNTHVEATLNHPCPALSRTRSGRFASGDGCS